MDKNIKVEVKIKFFNNYDGYNFLFKKDKEKEKKKEKEKGERRLSNSI